MTVAEALEGVSALLLDTAPVIYHLEGNPAYAPLMARFFQARAERKITLVTTPITLSECLVHPIKQGLAELGEAYFRLLVGGEGTEFRTIGSMEGREAARLRAEYDLRLGDALQVAVSVTSGCQAMLTNDDTFRRVREIRVLLLDDLEL